MDTTDIELLKFAPLKMQKEAENLAMELYGKKNARIEFLLIGTQIPRPVECVWLDPSFGMFQVKGHEDKGFMMVKSLPEGSVILNQRIEVDE